MNKRYLYLLAITLLVVATVSATVMVPFAFILPSDEVGVTLYYETKFATAPVKLNYVSTCSSRYAWGRGLKGVWMGYRGFSVLTSTLTIGDHFTMTKTPSTTVNCLGHTKSSTAYANYRLIVTAKFHVPATDVVPYMTLKTYKKDTKTITIPNEGTLPFSLYLKVKITGIMGGISTTHKGTATIKIVGDVDDYVKVTELDVHAVDSETNEALNDVPVNVTHDTVTKTATTTDGKATIDLEGYSGTVLVECGETLSHEANSTIINVYADKENTVTLQLTAKVPPDEPPDEPDDPESDDPDDPEPQGEDEKDEQGASTIRYYTSPFPPYLYLSLLMAPVFVGSLVVTFLLIRRHK